MVDIEKNAGAKTNIKQEAKSLMMILLFGLCFRILVMEPYYIPSSSMKDILLKGDYVFATKYSYGYSKYSMLFTYPDFIKGRIFAKEPERGDVIIFQPEYDKEKKYIKRLIALPGDKIQLKNSIVYLNGTALERKDLGEYIDSDGVYRKYQETLPNGLKYNILQLQNNQNELVRESNNTREFTVPEGHYFFLGDNRNESGDSRFQVGYVPFANLIAKARFFYFSASEELFPPSITFLEQLKQPYYWIKSLRFNRFFKNLYCEQ